jgi:broad specificity phosphatase PhoE
MLLYIIRHGQSTNNANLPRVVDPPLTPLGEEQSRRAAEALQGIGLTALHASPMRRALATALPISETVGLPVRVTPDLCEEDGLGKHSGMTRAEIAAMMTACEIPDSITEQGWWFRQQEGPEQVAARAREVAANLQSLYLNNGSERVAVVTHGTFASYLIRAFIAVSHDNRFHFLHNNAGISLIEFRPDYTFLRQLNRLDHLSPELVT